MSYTEIVAFKNQESNHTKDVKNAFRGAMAVWGLMEEKHLALKSAPWDPTQKLSRTSLMDPNGVKEIWELANNKDVPIDERIVMATTFDRVVVKRENFDKIIKAMRSFDKTYEGKSSILEQADIIESFIQDEDIDAVAWNQTSVNSNPWFDWSEEKEEEVPYNLSKNKDHWFLFDDLVFI